MISSAPRTAPTQACAKARKRSKSKTIITSLPQRRNMGGLLFFFIHAPENANSGPLLTHVTHSLCAPDAAIFSETGHVYKRYIRRIGYFFASSFVFAECRSSAVQRQRRMVHSALLQCSPHTVYCEDERGAAPATTLSHPEIILAPARRTKRLCESKALTLFRRRLIVSSRRCSIPICSRRSSLAASG